MIRRIPKTSRVARGVQWGGRQELCTLRPTAVAMQLQELNSGAAADVSVELMACCGCRSWAEAVVSERPFASVDDVVAAGLRRLREASDAQLLEAYAAHPRIGDVESLAKRFGSARAKLSEQEQMSTIAAASDDVLVQLKSARFVNEIYMYLYILVSLQEFSSLVWQGKMMSTLINLASFS